MRTSSGAFTHGLVLSVLNLLQVLLYIPLLALLGQGVLFVLSGHKRQQNVFYQTLQVVSKPFTWPLRKILPAKVADHHVPLIAFFALSILSFVVFAERGYLMCVATGQAGCQR
jgi:uncharacterized protein YggT (Ycf19 family)